MNAIRTLKQLKAAAIAAGYTVGERQIIHTRHRSVYWYEDGSIYRCGIPLTMAKQMRVMDAASFLGLR